MKNKRFLALLLFFALCLSACASSAGTASNSSTSHPILTLNQNKAYVAVSSNDENSRTLPFYFTYANPKAESDGQAYSILNDQYVQANLYAEDALIGQVDNIHWTVSKLGAGRYTVQLDLTPSLSDFQFDDIKRITKLELTAKNNTSQTFELPDYLVQQKETLSKDVIEVQGAMAQSTIDKNDKAQTCYTILAKGNEIDSVALEYPKQLFYVKDDSLNKTKSEAGGVTYQFSLRLSEGGSKAIFRPFVKLTYNDGQEGYVLASFPVVFQ
jgi:hypothetical protein